VSKFVPLLTVLVELLLTFEERVSKNFFTLDEEAGRVLQQATILASRSLDRRTAWFNGGKQL
jgi:hypothetical protein